MTTSSATLAVLGNWKLSVYMMSVKRATTPPQIQESQDATTMARAGGGDDGTGCCIVPSRVGAYRIALKLRAKYQRAQGGGASHGGQLARPRNSSLLVSARQL